MTNRIISNNFNRTSRILLALAFVTAMILNLTYEATANSYIQAELPGGFNGSGNFAILSNGDVVFAGYTINSYNVPAGALALYKSDGSLDTSLQPDGMFATGLVNSRVAAQSGDRLIVAGFKDNGYRLARYSLDGSLDTSFSSGVVLPFSSFSIAIQPDDKILLAGGDAGGDFALLRFNSDGSPDSSFDGDGFLTTDFSGGSDWANSIAVLSNGKIAAAGVSDYGSIGQDFALALYNPDGSLDTSFDGDGLVTSDFTDGEDFATSIAVQPDDRIIVAGYSDQGSTGFDFALARYNLDGSLDTSFSADGLLTTDFVGGNDGIRSIAIHPDGRLVVAGFTEDPNVPVNYRGDLALARYLPDGGLDPSFGIGGKKRLDFTPGLICCNRDSAWQVAPGIDGWLVIAASSVDATGLGANFLLFLPESSNQIPEMVVDSPGITISEGQMATNSGSISDPDGDALTLSASIGSITNNNDGTWSWSHTPDDGPAESQSVSISADDGNGGIAVASFDLTVNNTAPAAVFQNDGPVGEGSSFTLSLAYPNDPSSSDTNAGFAYAFDCGDGSGYHAFGSGSSLSCPTDDDGVRAVRAQIRDKDGGLNEYTANVFIGNLAPELGPLLLSTDISQIQTTIDFTVAFTDPGVLDVQYVFLDWGDGSSSTIDSATSPVSSAHSYAEPGVYIVALSVSDDDGDATSGESDYLVIYDPDGGFVSGGGWIDSSPGAYNPDPDLAGKANFGFVSRYKKGANVPDGSTEFHFQAGDFNFHSDRYDWLVVNQAGTNAQFRGNGKINGELAPNGTSFKFMLWAGDGSPDTFRIKIWYEDPDEEVLVYDNGVDQPLGGGNIIVHQSR